MLPLLYAVEKSKSSKEHFDVFQKASDVRRSTQFKDLMQIKQMSTRSLKQVDKENNNNNQVLPNKLNKDLIVTQTLNPGFVVVKRRKVEELVTLPTATLSTTKLPTTTLTNQQKSTTED